MPGLESAGETAEKVVPLVRFPILMRIILPGALGTAILFPFTGLSFTIFEVNTLEELGKHAIQLLLLCFLVFVLGAIIAAFNNEIYKIYEGRSFWPSRLWTWGLKRQQQRLNRLRRLAQYAPSQNPVLERRRRESWEALRSYPTDEQNEYYADMPTRLGNILAGYEQYPRTRYNMSAMFYLPRILMRMDKEKKDDLDSSWAIADGLLGLSATAAIGALLWLTTGVLSFFELSLWKDPYARDGSSFFLGAGLLVAGYVFYRISLPFHKQNGEVFKGIFDLYRGRVWHMTKLREGEREAWDKAWLYFQYRRMRCNNCGKESADDKQLLPGQTCAHCGHTSPTFRA